FFGTAGALLDHFRGIAAEVFLDDLKNRPRILKRLVLEHRGSYERCHQRVERRSLLRLTVGLRGRRGRRLLSGVLPSRAVVLIDKTVERPFCYAALGRREAGKNSV